MVQIIQNIFLESVQRSCQAADFLAPCLVASMAGERRRCRLKIAEEEILPVSPEVRGRRLLPPPGSRADVPPAPLLGTPREQSFLAHILISPSSSSSSMGSVGTALPSCSGRGEAVFGRTRPGEGRKRVCREPGAVVSACRLHVNSMQTQRLQLQIFLFIWFHKR